MRVKVTQENVYTYPELSERAQEKVREWWNRVQWDDGQANESMSMIFDGIMEDEGWEADPRSLTYSLYSQGGTPSWSGTKDDWEYEGKTYILTCRNKSRGGSSDYNSVDVEHEDDDEWNEKWWEGDPETRRVMNQERERIREAAKDYVRGLESKLHAAFEKEDEYMGSDEYVREACEANGYEFTEDGDLA